MILWQPFLRKLQLFFAAFFFLLITVPSVRAQTPEQNKVYNSGIGFFDYEEYACQFSGEEGTGGPANLDVSADFSLGTGAAERRVNLVRVLMRDYKLNEAQASGIVGNFMHESGGYNLPPARNQGDSSDAPPKFDGLGYGWAQWTGGSVVRRSGKLVGVGGRQGTFIAFAVNNGFMRSENVKATDAANYAYLKHELANGYEDTITAVKRASGVRTATIAFMNTFEKPGDPQTNKRVSAAQTVFNEVTGRGGEAGNTGSRRQFSDPQEGLTCGTGSASGATVIGGKAFPVGNKKSDVNNPGMFNNGNTDQGDHPYTAYDILADPGTPVYAYISGTVNHIGTDKCPGRLISIYNKENNLTVSYLHLAMRGHVQDGTKVSAGQRVGAVGTDSNGCGIAHLHIDVARGNDRPGCSRENCPSSNASKFVDIGADLFKLFQALPK